MECVGTREAYCWFLGEQHRYLHPSMGEAGSEKHREKVFQAKIKRKQVSPPCRASALQHPRPCRPLLELGGDLCEGRAGASRTLCGSSASFFAMPASASPSPPCLFRRQPLGFAGATAVLGAAWYPSRAPAPSLSAGSGDAFLGGFQRAGSGVVWPSEGSRSWDPWALACQLFSWGWEAVLPLPRFG